MGKGVPCFSSVWERQCVRSHRSHPAVPLLSPEFRGKFGGEHRGFSQFAVEMAWMMMTQVQVAANQQTKKTNKHYLIYHT